MRASIIGLCLLAGCGSGAISDPSTKPVPSPLSVSPPSATVYPGLATNFTVSSSGTYTVVSDNQGVVTSPGVSGNAFAIVPNSVNAETKLNLLVSDGVSSVKVPITVEPIQIAPLAALPATLAFQGSSAGTCAFGIHADVLVYGGRPPYTVSQPSAFQVDPIIITANPGRLTVTSTGQCGSGAIAIVDSVGASATVTATNTLSTATTPPATPFSVGPGTVELTGCNDVAHVILVGGTGRYFAASGNDSLYANVDGPNTGLIHRNPSDASPASVPVVFSDGITTATVNVTVQYTGKCPKP